MNDRPDLDEAFGIVPSAVADRPDLDEVFGVAKPTGSTETTPSLAATESIPKSSDSKIISADTRKARSIAAGVIGRDYSASKLAGANPDMYEGVTKSLNEISTPEGKAARALRDSNGDINKAISRLETPKKHMGVLESFGVPFTGSDEMKVDPADMETAKRLRKMQEDLTAAGVDPKDHGQVIQDAAKENAWTENDTDKTRVLSDGEVVFNPGQLFGDRDTLVKDIQSKAKTPEIAQKAIERLDASRTAAADTMTTDLYYNDQRLFGLGEFRDFEAERAAKGQADDKIKLLDDWMKQQKDRNMVWKANDVLWSGVTKGELGIAKTALGVGAQATALLSPPKDLEREKAIKARSEAEFKGEPLPSLPPKANSTMASLTSALAGAQRFLGEVSSNAEEAEKARGLTGGYKIANDLVTTTTEMLPMFAVGKYAEGLDGFAKAVTTHMAVGGWAAAQGWESATSSILENKAQQKGAPLTGEEIVSTLREPRTLATAFADATQTVALSYLLPKGSQRGVLGAPAAEAEAMTIRDFIGAGGAKVLKDGTFRKEIKALAHNVWDDVKDEALEESLNQMLEDVIVAAGTGQNLKLGDAIKNWAYSGALGGLAGGAVNQVQHGEAHTRPEIADAKETVIENADAAPEAAAAALAVLNANGKPVDVVDPGTGLVLDAKAQETLSQIQEPINDENTPTPEDTTGFRGAFQGAAKGIGDAFASSLLERLNAGKYPDAAGKSRLGEAILAQQKIKPFADTAEMRAFVENYDSNENTPTPDLGDEGTPVAPVDETAQPALTDEATQLLAKVDAGGVPMSVTPNLERIAAENGIPVTGSTKPQEIIDQLRIKSNEQNTQGLEKPSAETAQPAPTETGEPGGVPPGDGGTTLPRVQTSGPAEPVLVQENLVAGLERWKGNTSDLLIHISDELSGAPTPSSLSGGKLRNQAKAIVQTLAKSPLNPITLYRGGVRSPQGIQELTSSKKVAHKWAKKYGGEVHEIPPNSVPAFEIGTLIDNAADRLEKGWLADNNFQTQPRPETSPRQKLLSELGTPADPNFPDKVITPEGARIELTQDGDQIKASIVVPPESRRQGAGTAAMQRLVDLATVPITLDVQPTGANPEPGMGKEELTRWYAKFGFVDKGDGTMTLNPTTLQNDLTDGVGAEQGVPVRDTSKPEQMTPDEWIALDTEMRRLDEMPDGGSEQTEEERKFYDENYDTWVGNVKDVGANILSTDWAGATRRATAMLDPEHTPTRENATLGAKNVGSYIASISAASGRFEPVSAEAVDAYGIKLPEGYVKQGDLYVYPSDPQLSSVENPPELKAVRAKDFQTSGNYEVQTPDGTRRIFRDPESGAWMDADRRAKGFPTSPFPYEFLGYTKAEALAELKSQTTPDPQLSTAENPPDLETIGDPEALTPPVEPPEVIAGTHAVSDAERERLGMKPRMPQPKWTEAEAWDAAVATADADPQAGSKLLDYNLAEQKFTLTPEEHALMVHEILTRRAATEAAYGELNALPADASSALRDAALNRATAAQAAYDTLWTYMDAVGSAAGSALRARQLRVELDFSISTMMNQARAAMKGKDLTESQKRQIIELSQKLQEAQARIDSLVEENTEQGKLVEQLTADVERANGKREARDLKTKSRIKKKLDPMVAAAQERLRAKGYGTQSDALNAGADPEVIKDISIVAAGWLVDKTLDLAEFTNRLTRDFGDWILEHAENIFGKSRQVYNETEASIRGVEAPSPADVLSTLDGTQPLDKSDVWALARAHVIAGKRGTNVLDSVFTDLSAKYPSLSREDVAVLFTDYGKVSYPSTNETSVQLRKIRTMERLQEHILRLKRGEAPLGTGLRRDAPDVEIRQLEKQYRQLAKEVGITAVDPERQLKSALASAKTRMQNEIDELQAAIDAGKARAAKGNVVEFDAEALDLKARLDAKRNEYNAAFPKEGLTDAQRAAMVVKALDRQIAEEDAMLRDGVLKRPKGESIKETPEIAEKRRLLAEKRQTRRNLYEAQNPGETALQQTKNAVTRSIERLTKIRESGVIAIREKRTVDPDAELSAMLELRDSLSDEVRELRRAMPLSPAQQARQVEIAMKAAQRTLDRIQERLDNNDLSIPVKTPTAASRNAAVVALREQIKAANQELAKRRRDAKPKLSPEEARTNRQLASLQKRSEELQRRLKEKDVSRKPKVDPVHDPRVRRAQYEYEKLKADFSTLQGELALENATPMQKAKYYIMGAANAMKVITLGGDVGVIFRQLGTTYQALAKDIALVSSAAVSGEARQTLKQRGSSLGRLLKVGAMTLFDESIETSKYEEIMNRPGAEFDKADGMYYAPPFDAFNVKAEDLPRAEFIQNIPWWIWPALAGVKVAAFGVAPVPAALMIGLGTFTKPMLQKLDRAQRVMTNVARAEFIDAARAGASANGARMLTAGDRKVLATAVMVATGRGKASSVEAAIPVANQFLLATRFYISRIQALSLYPIWSNVNSDATKHSRAEVAKMYGQSLAGRAALYTLLIAMFGRSDDEEDKKNGTVKGMMLNPYSSDFGRLKLSENLKIDFMSGINGFASISARYLGKRRLEKNGKYTALGAGYANNVNDEAMRFIGTKFNLLFSLVKNTHAGAYYGGKPATTMNFVDQATTMIMTNDIIRIFQELGPVRGAVVATLMLGGAGTSIRPTDTEQAQLDAQKKLLNKEMKLRQRELNETP